VGTGQDGHPVWISKKMASHAEVGKIGPRLSFRYGKSIACHTFFQGRSSFPGILINPEQFAWVETCTSEVLSLQERAVPLGVSPKGVLHAVKILFCGWQSHHEGQDQGHDHVNDLTSLQSTG